MRRALFWVVVLTLCMVFAEGCSPQPRGPELTPHLSSYSATRSVSRNLGNVFSQKLKFDEASLQKGGALNPLRDQLRGKSCQVYQDRQGIPHIHVPSVQQAGNMQHSGENLLAFSCLGYIHARERGWEMDFFRRTVQGRKSEVLGKNSIKSDFLFRLLGLSEKAESLFQQLPSRYQNILWAYTWGVNQGMKAALEKGGKGIYEFHELGYMPEVWRPEDSIAIILLQSFDQTRRSFQLQFEEKDWLTENEGTHENGAGKGKGMQISELFGLTGLPWATTILKEGEYFRSSAPSPVLPPEGSPSVPSSLNNHDLNREGFFEEIHTPAGGTGQGSNSWVLGPSRSKTGHAWLANDPHLRLSRPPFWHWLHLDSGDMNVIGATLPGVPVFASASNLHVSWGVTNSYLPVARANLVSTEELKQATTLRPLIWVRLWKFQLPLFFKTFQRTQSGLPILPVDTEKGKSVVLRWSGYDLAANEVMGFVDLITASTAEQADRILSGVQLPSWNFVFADDRGKIGYRAIGRVPRFAKDPGWGVPEKSLSEVETWQAFGSPLSADEMPHILNPRRGYVVTANNLQWPRNSRWSAGHAQVSSFRAFRIEELLQAKGQHDLESQQRIQCDVQAVDARYLVPELLKIAEAPQQRTLWKPEDARVFQILKEWNFESDLKCTACAVYRRWVSHLTEKRNVNSAALYRQLVEKADPTLGKDVLVAFHTALEDLSYSTTHVLPAWGAVHLNGFHHLAGKDFFPIRPISTPGDEHTVNPGVSEWTGTFFDHDTGASERLIVEMSQPPRVYSVLPGANLDTLTQAPTDPGSPWQRWAQCILRQQEFPIQWSQFNPANLETIVFD